MSFQNGMLWFDNSDDDLQVKVKRGALSTQKRAVSPRRFVSFTHLLRQMAKIAPLAI